MAVEKDDRLIRKRLVRLFLQSNRSNGLVLEAVVLALLDQVCSH